MAATASSQSTGSPVAAAGQADGAGVKGRMAMLFMLAFIYSLNYLDRQIVIILQEPVKHAFGLADWELGLLTGGAFGVFYTSMGIPIAHIIDRGVNRVRLISGFIAVWSVMTAMCGITGSFGQFFAARMGVGLAEAGFAPAAHSLISDLFPPRERAAAAGIFGLGVPLGVMAGLSIGGIVAQLTDWRTALLVAGAPGLLAALVFPLIAREPARGASETAPHLAATEPSTSFLDTLRILARRRPFVHVVAGSAAFSFAQAGLAAWTPSFMIRAHAMSLGRVGLTLGLLTGVFAGLGTWLGGWQGSRLSRTMGLQGMIWIPVVVTALCAPLYIAVVLIPDGNTALVLLALPIFLGAIWTAPSIALTQSLSPVAMRARASAVYIVAANLVGVSMGPLFAGALSDWFAGINGGDGARGLRDAMIVLTVFLFWGSAHWLRAAQLLRREHAA